MFKKYIDYKIKIFGLNFDPNFYFEFESQRL